MNCNKISRHCTLPMIKMRLFMFVFYLEYTFVRFHFKNKTTIKCQWSQCHSIPFKSTRNNQLRIFQTIRIEKNVFKSNQNVFQVKINVKSGFLPPKNELFMPPKTCRFDTLNWFVYQLESDKIFEIEISVATATAAGAAQIPLRLLLLLLLLLRFLS